MVKSEEPVSKWIWACLALAWIFYGFTYYGEWKEEQQNQIIRQTLIETRGSN